MLPSRARRDRTRAVAPLALAVSLLGWRPAVRPAGFCCCRGPRPPRLDGGTRRRCAAPAAAAELRDPDLRRFEVGTRVRCRMSVTAWAPGTVTRSNYGPSHEVAPYQVRLDEGSHLIWVPEDDDQIIQGLGFWDSPLGALRRQFELDHAVQWQQGRRRLPVTAGGGAAVPVVPHQLERDIEQFEHLLSKGALGSDVGEYVADAVLPDYRRALETANSSVAGSGEGAHALPNQPQFESVFGLHRKALHLHPGDPVPGGAIRPRDFEAIEREFREREHHAVVIDDFFSQEALEKIRDFLMDSTFWFDAKNGYVGTYAETGFASPLVAQIDQELRSSFPGVIGDLELQNCWAFMFDGSMGGVRTHADNAQVQINFFLTPSDANEWSEDDTLPGGGLVIYGVGPPEDMSLLELNLENDEAKEHILASSGHWNVTVPYVQNRAILFDSTYFHRTDDMRFKKGYRNRRINMTFLYGRRADLKPAAAVSAQTKPKPAIELVD